MPDTLTSFRLCGDAVQLPLLIEAASRNACTILRAEDGLAALDEAGDGPVLVALGDLSAERLERALQSPIAACVEVFCGRIFDGPDVAIGADGRGLYLGLSSASAYGLEPARFFCEALGRRLGLADEQRMNIDLALHEAVVNALTHGSLELSSSGRQTVEDFMQFCQAITDRLADPHYATRRVEIIAGWTDEILTIAVTDEGPGYDFKAINSSGLGDDDDPGRKSGRGLGLIRDLSAGLDISHDGRRLTMRFVR